RDRRISRGRRAEGCRIRREKNSAGPGRFLQLFERVAAPTTQMASQTDVARAPQDQQDLVRACAGGDRNAQTRLFRAEVQRVHALLHRVLGGSPALEDLVQESFIRVFRSLPAFRGEAQLATWIGRIVLRVACEHLRAARPAAARLESVPDVSSEGPDAEQQLAAREGLRRLYRILDRLDPKLRIAFTLHVVDGRPQQEVAALMS